MSKKQIDEKLNYNKMKINQKIWNVKNNENQDTTKKFKIKKMISIKKSQ